MEGDGIHHIEQQRNAHDDEVEDAEREHLVAEVHRELLMDVVQPGDVHKADEQNLYDQAKLCGAEAKVGEAELVLHNLADARVDGESEVARESEERYGQADEGREAGADEEERLVEHIDVVIQIIAVEGALGVAHTRHGTVEAVAIPIDKQTDDHQPEELEANIAEQEADEAHHGAQHTDERQRVARHLTRHAVGYCH